MNKDYENFVERMGSFEDVISLDDEPEDLVALSLKNIGKSLS